MYEEKKGIEALDLKKSEKSYQITNTITSREQQLLEKEISGVLNGIPDIIKVYNPDYTISFFNEAGYNFYSKVQSEIKGKRCYEILGRSERCSDCSFEEVMETKNMISKEKYIPELNKFMDVCYSPVLDENEEILYIVERLRDITEKKILDKICKENGDRYKQIINSIPDAVVIIVDNLIVLANQEAYNLLNLLDIKRAGLIGSNIYRYFQEKYVKSLHKKFRNILLHKKIKDTSDYEFVFHGNKVANLQISYSYISYEGNPAIIAIIRDITEFKKELNKAAEFQRKTLQNDFPAKDKVNITTTYMPAKTVSGDFYRIYRIDENLIVGMLGDVRGKGISAALSISAFDMLCAQEIAVTHEPMEIVMNLNKKLIDYYEENYIAACCFSMNFSEGELKAVGAGINRFIFQREQVQEEIIEGTFLGMFEDSEFSEKIIKFEQGDKFIFFSDGLDFILDEDKVIETYIKDVNIFEFKDYIEQFLGDTILEFGKLEDDCTMIAMEIK
jgi:PAS domain S-box-containing protein